MDKKIRDYIEKQEPFKQVLIKKSRKLMLDTIPDCREEFNWGALVYDGGKFYIAAMKTRVHIGFAITGLNKKEAEEFEGTGKMMRHVKIHSLEEFDKKKLVRLIRLVSKKTMPPSDYHST